MIYLAQPYTHKRSDVVHARFKIGEFMTWHYMKAGEHIFSPIVMCHKISKLYEMPTDFAFWMEYDYDIIRSSKEVRVLQLPNWQDSVGVAAEIKFALENNIPITYVSWDEIEPLARNYRDKWGENILGYYLDCLK